MSEIILGLFYAALMFLAVPVGFISVGVGVSFYTTLIEMRGKGKQSVVVSILCFMAGTGSVIIGLMGMVCPFYFVVRYIGGCLG